MYMCSHIPTLSPQTWQQVVGNPSSGVYLASAHTDVKATEAGAVGGISFDTCPQETCGWRMRPAADTSDMLQFLEISILMQLTQIHGHGWKWMLSKKA